MLKAQKDEIRSDLTRTMELISTLEQEYAQNKDNVLLGLTLGHKYYLVDSFEKAIPLYFAALDEDLLMNDDLIQLVHLLLENGQTSQAKEINAIIKERAPADYTMIKEVIQHKERRSPQTLEAYIYFKNSSAPTAYSGNLSFRNAGGIHLERKEKDIRITQPLRIKGHNPEHILHGIIHPQNEDLWLTEVIKSRTIISISEKKKDLEYGSTSEFELSDKKSNYVYPCFNASGNVLIFASDMPGGEGGYDLYCSILTKGVWSKPENLGPEINTERDELHPYLDASNLLYFSSNGKPGLGGYDIYVADMEAEEPKLWHLAQPFNSAGDDGGIVALSSERWFLSSNREGSRTLYQLAAKVIEPKTYYYRGRILDAFGKGISGANLITEEEGNLTEISSDASGNFVMSRKGLPVNEVGIKIQKQGYTDTSYVLEKEDYEERLYTAKTHIIRLKPAGKKATESAPAKKTVAVEKKVESKPVVVAEVQKVEKKPGETEKSVVESETVSPNEPSYYAILASSKKESESNEFAQKLKSRYPSVVVLNSASGYYRVAVPLGSKQEEAVKSLRECRKVVADAWLLKQ